MTTATQTMSITRALAELKRLDDKISRAITGSTFVGIQIGKNVNAKPNGVQGTVATVAAQIQGAFDSLDAMFNQRDSIKSKIVQSNAVTKVTIAGREVTVAEAIELKRSVTNKRDLLNVLKRQQTAVNATISAHNAKLDEAIDSQVKALYTSEKGAKVTSEQFDNVSKPMKEQKEASVIDPKDIVKSITALEELISVVDTELDFTLSEINAKTTISV